MAVQLDREVRVSDVELQRLSKHTDCRLHWWDESEAYRHSQSPRVEARWYQTGSWRGGSGKTSWKTKEKGRERTSKEGGRAKAIGNRYWTNIHWWSKTSGGCYAVGYHWGRWMGSGQQARSHCFGWVLWSDDDRPQYNRPLLPLTWQTSSLR